MATTHIISAAVAAAANGTSSASTDSSGGNFIFVTVSSYATAAAPALNDNKGNTYTARAATVNSDVRLQTFWCSSAVCGTGHVWTLSGTGSYSQAFISVFAAAGGLVVDQSSSYLGAALPSVQAGSITPTEAGELIVMSEVGIATPGSVTDGFAITGEGVQSGSGYGGGQAWLVQGAAAAINPTWSGAGGGGVQAQIVSFKAAAASTTAAMDAVIPALQWSGSVSSAMLAAFAGELPPLAWSGSALLSAGRLTSRAFHNGAVMPLASGAIPYVMVCSLDLSAATRFTAQSYDANGFWTIADDAIEPGTDYLVLYSDGAGTYASEVLAAT